MEKIKQVFERLISKIRPTIHITVSATPPDKTSPAALARAIRLEMDCFQKP